MIMADYRFLKLVSYFRAENWSAIAPVVMASAFDESCNVKLSSIIKRVKNAIIVEDDKKYIRITIRQYGQGVHARDTVLGTTIGTKRQFVATGGQLIVSGIDARNGSIGVVPDELTGAIVTNDFWLFDITTNVVPQYLIMLLSSNKFQQYWQSKSSGTTNRQRINQNDFLEMKMPLPAYDIQQKIADNYNVAITEAVENEQSAEKLGENVENVLFQLLGVDAHKNTFAVHSQCKYLSVSQFSAISEWGYDKIANRFPYYSTMYNNTSIGQNNSLFRAIYRGKSPKYSPNSTAIILNQKCNRWNEIALEHAKTVDQDWLRNVDDDMFTKHGDILINSTGEGTIGRATCILNNQYINLLFDSHIILLRLNMHEVNPLFFTFLFNSSFGQMQVELLKGAQATKQTELGVENLKKFLFPLPPLEVQQQIADKILAIKEQIIAHRQKADSLRKLAKRQFEEDVFGE